MAGTTVDDRVDGLPLVLKCYDDAFRAHGVEVPIEVLNAQRGRDKWTVIKELGGAHAEAIYAGFIRALRSNIGSLRKIEGASTTFRFLREHGVKVVVSTGFPREIAEQIIKSLGWGDEGLIDGWVCSEQVGASRPDPAMILYAMKKLQVHTPEAVMKVDDTVKGIEEGLNAGAYTVGVLTGTQSIQQLSAANPDAILRSVADIPDHLREKALLI